MKLTISSDAFRIYNGFTIARGSRTHATTVTVSLRQGNAIGRGECTPYARYGESVESVTAQIETVRDSLEQGASRQELQSLLPAGAARNAVDCAMWDLEAKSTGKSIASLANISAPPATTTAYTLSLDTPEAMGKAAFENRHRPLLKIKLGGQGDDARMRAVCAQSGDAEVIVDANEAWNADVVWSWLQLAADLGIALVEQPLPAGEDAILREQLHPVPVCADESAHACDSLEALKGLYDVVNIKLDKTGGLTEAFKMQHSARAEGFGVFVGCMMGSSLAIAPAFMLTGDADFVDLDAPLLLAEDRDPAMHFEGSKLFPPSPQLWG